MTQNIQQHLAAAEDFPKTVPNMTVCLNKPAVWDPLPSSSDTLWNTKVDLHHQCLSLSCPRPRTCSLVRLSKWHPIDVFWIKFSSIGNISLLPRAYNITVVWAGVVVQLCPHLQTSEQQQTQPFQWELTPCTEDKVTEASAHNTQCRPVCNSRLFSLTLYMKNFTFLSNKYGVFTGNLLFPE